MPTLLQRIDAATSLVGWRLLTGSRRRPLFTLVLLGQKAELIDACGPDFIHDRNHIAVLRSSVALHVHGLVEAIGDAILDLPGDVFFSRLGMAKIDVAIARDRHDDGIILVRILHFVRVSVLAMSTGMFFCNIGVTTMKMISRTSMMSAMGMTFGAAIWLPACGL